MQVTIREVSVKRFTLRMLLASGTSVLGVRGMLWMLLTKPAAVLSMLGSMGEANVPDMLQVTLPLLC